MIVDLLQVTTSDGVRLDGALEMPVEGVLPAAALDAVVCVHGTGSNFYASTLMEAIARRLTELGVAALRVNTRGHDLMSTASTSSGGRRAGAAYEKVDDCRHDLAAWIDVLRQRGWQRIGLLGHSLGALKSIYTLGTAPQESVAALVAISPPRLSHAYFLDSPQAEVFAATYALAESHVAEGRPEALLEVTFPLPYVVTAAGYLDKYNRDERYNISNHLGTITAPTLVTYGSLEVQSNVAFRDMPAQIEAVATGERVLQVAEIAGADHFYSGARSELIARVERWLRRTLPV